MSKRSNRHISRRQFLIGAGNAMLCLPLLSLMHPLAAFAATGRAKRVILIPTLFGIDQNKFFPAVPTASLTPVVGAVDMYTAPLAGISGNLSSVFGTIFNNPVLRAKMNIYNGLDVTHGGVIVSHTRGSLAGVAANRDLGGGNYEPKHGETIDNILAKSPNFYKTPPPFPVMRLSTGASSSDWSYEFVAGKINFKSSVMGDKAIFEKFFANVGTGSTGPDQNKLGIVDRILGDLNVLKSQRRLSAGDRQLLDRYVTSVNELDARIRANVAPACSKPALSLQVTREGQYYAFPGDYDGLSWGIRSTKAMLDNYHSLIANAFLCDLSRVVVYGNSIFQDSPLSRYSADALFHSHDDGTGGPLTTAQKHAWFIEQIANLALKLDSIPDPLSESGTLLDNTIILFTNEHGGPGAAHNSRQIPTFTIGSMGGSFKTGLYFDTRQRPLFGDPGFRGQIGRPNKQLLISVMEAAGLTRDEYIIKGGGQGFGDFVATDGESGSPGYARFTATHNDPLPFLKA